MKKKWRNFFRVLMISPVPAMYPTEQEKYEAYEQSLAHQPDGMPAPLSPEHDAQIEFPHGHSPDEPSPSSGETNSGEVPGGEV